MDLFNKNLKPLTNEELEQLASKLKIKYSWGVFYKGHITKLKTETNVES